MKYNYIHMYRPAFIFIAINCAALSSIDNGGITYDPVSSDPVTLDYGTTATYSCNDGFFLEGNVMRNCGGDGTSLDGVWDGVVPICSGKL